MSRKKGCSQFGRYIIFWSTEGWECISDNSSNGLPEIILMGTGSELSLSEESAYESHVACVLEAVQSTTKRIQGVCAATERLERA